ncbi:hypothetical protein, conserved, partial [Eimeria maxima]
MASKADCLKKYLRGARKPQGPPSGAQGGLRLGEDEELDLRPARRRGGPSAARGGQGRRTLFTVLRQAEDGARYLFKDENALEMEDEDLLGSDPEEVRVVGEDGQALVLSEADKAKINELIAREEQEEDEDVQHRGVSAALLRGRRVRCRARGGAEAPLPKDNSNSWKEAFALEGPVGEVRSSYLSAANPYEERERRRLGLQAGGEGTQIEEQEEGVAAARQDPGSRDISLPRGRADAEIDISPPRRRADAERDISPPRRRADADRGVSPPRRADADRNISPPRRADVDRDISPPRRRTDAGRDMSPPRRRADAGRDISPPRKKADADRDISPPRRPRGGPEPILLAGPPTGGGRASSLRLNSAQEGHQGKQAQTSSSGERDISPLRPNAGGEVENMEETRQEYPGDRRPTNRVVFRDREGRIISEEEWLALEGEKGRKKQRERGPAPVLEWGAGLKQKEDRKARQREEEKIAKQPFA